jgi:hypothetical protein
MNKITKLLVLLLAPVAALHAAESSAPIATGQRIFSTGHSFHFGFPAILDEIAKSAGVMDSTNSGLSSIGGSIVDRHYGGTNVMAALTAGQVDVLMTTPIYLPDPGIEKFAQFGFEHNPAFRLMVMEFWLPFDNYEPRNYKNGAEHVAPPANVDHNAATAEALQKMHQRYFDEMDAEVARINLKLGKTVVRVVPVGQAVNALREKIMAGQAPGLEKQWDLFTDNLGHPKMPLTILMGYCHYAVIYRKSPVGLPVPKALAGVKQAAELNRLLQDLAWNAVTHHPLSGVRDDPVVLDASLPGSRFDGIGAISGGGAITRLLIDYPEPQRSDILDFLFKPNFGASLQELKVEIGGDINSTEGPEPSFARTREEFEHPTREYFNRGYEWWMMREARKRNPKIEISALQWGAPAWVGGGKFWSQDNADYIVAFIKGAKKYHGVDVAYAGCWNEKPCDVAWVKLLRKTLDNNGLKQVRIIAADEPNWNIVKDLEKDAELRKAVYSVGVHYPRLRIKEPVSPDAAKALGIPLWATEDGPWTGEWQKGAYSGSMQQVLNQNYVIGKMTKTCIWNIITSFYNVLEHPGSGIMRANTPWSGNYTVQPNIWLVAHTTQFIQPQWKYLGGNACAMLSGGGSRVAAVSPNGKEFSVVIETADAKVSQRLMFKVAGKLSARPLHVWRSNIKEQFVQLNDIPIVDGAFTVEADPESVYTITTTTGQRKGVAAHPVPPAQSFPLPYKDDFENDNATATPKYISDMHGAFEVAKRADGGQCLKQVILERGIEWCGGFEPCTIVGSCDYNGKDMWTDYEVGVDVCFDFKQYVWLYGRFCQIHYVGRPPYGYCVKVEGDGSWKLLACDKKLVEGKVNVVAGSWHRVGLRMKGEKITVLFDGSEVGAVTDATYKYGMVGLGCGFEAVKFDNLTIERAEAPALEKK